MVWLVKRSWWQSSCLRFFFLDQVVWSGFLCHGHASALLKELLSSLLQFVSSKLYGVAILDCSSLRILISQSTWFSTYNLLPVEGAGQFLKEGWFQDLSCSEHLSFWWRCGNSFPLRLYRPEKGRGSFFDSFFFFWSWCNWRSGIL